MSDGRDIGATGAERLRVPVECPVDLRFDDSQDFRREVATDLSMLGMFIRTTATRPVGTTFEVHLELPDDQPVRARVEVLWRRVRDHGRDRPRGIGVRFLDLSLEDKYAISRVVDRYVQLGGKPLRPQLVVEGATVRGAPRRAARLASLILLGALAGFAVGLLWGLRLGETAGGDVPLSAQQRSSRAAGDDSSPASETEGPAHDATAEVAAAVAAWARAWSVKDVESYLRWYSDEYRPASGQSLAAWQGRRRSLLNRPGAITVEISALEIESASSSRAIARFDQTFVSRSYRDRVRKELELARRAAGATDHEWRIIRERVLEELPPDPDLAPK